MKNGGERMTRISHKGIKEKKTSLIAVQYTFFTALYVRLSLEEQEGHSTEKIRNQKELLLEYIREKPECQLVDIYCDNGCTGTNFDRPQWQRLMTDVKMGRINCIIVKDLSRLGRNYIETGNYLEKIFPFMGIRFIAVNDGYDSENIKPEDTGLLLSIKNIVNSSYAEDLSKKIASTRHIQRVRGEFTGSVIPFGYKKDRERKGRFLVNEDEAAVVRKIFQLFGEGESYSGIARELNRLRIASPKGKMWRYQSIREIIANEVYLGRMIQGRHCTRGVEVAVDNTHDAIITKELFEKVKKQKEKISFHKQKAMDTEEYFFKGILNAANSGLTLCKTCYWKQSGQVLVKAYRSPKAFDKEGNPYKLIMIREEVLLSVIKKVLLQYFLVLEDTLGQEAIQKSYQHKIKHIDGEQQALYKEIMHKKELLSYSYQDLANGILDSLDYKRIQKQYKEDIIYLEEKIKENEKGLMECKQLVKMKSPHTSLLLRFGKSQKVTKDFLSLFVLKIVVINSREVQIIFSFEDEFRSVCVLTK